MGSPLLRSHGLTRFHAPDGSELWMDDATGKAFRADCSRAPEFDGPASPAPLDRAEVARVLAAMAREIDETEPEHEATPNDDCPVCASMALEHETLERVASRLSLSAEFAALTNRGAP